jgi:hypothetical protein
MKSATHFGGCQDRAIRLLAREESAHRGLVGQVEFGMGARDHLDAAFAQLARDRSADHAAMACNIDPHRMLLHQPSTETGSS